MRTAIHDVGVWLPRTKTWLYNEISELAGGWNAWAIANRTENVSEFPFPNLYSLRDQVGKPRWALEMALRRARLTAHAPSISRFCDSLHADLLHSHFGTVGWLNLGFARRLSVPHIVTFYGFDVTQVPREKRWLTRYRKMFDEVSRVLCEGPHMASEIAKLGCDPAKISVHRLGVRLAELPYRARHQSSTAPRFLMAGSFREKKGLVDGLTALGRLSDSRPQDHWSLTIVGGPGEHREGKAIAGQLTEIGRRYNIEDRISYTGFLSHAELIKEAEQHDIFICPSVTASNGDTEGGAPVVMIEMAAMGLPVIATRHCDMPTVLGEKNRSLLVSEGDGDALLQSIEWLFDHPEVWPEFGADNRARSNLKFDHAVQAIRLAAIYDAVIA
jgi:colanic acid/amylovoran biosynthesis glycosyltransferase